MQWNDKAEAVMDIAKQFAKRYRHAFVDSGHVLAGLLGECYSMAPQILVNSGIDARMVLEKVKYIERNFSLDSQDRDLTWTQNAVNITLQASKEAEKLGHSYVGTEHLLLAICEISEGEAAEYILAGEILKNFGVNIKELKSKILEGLGFATLEESEEKIEDILVEVPIEIEFELPLEKDDAGFFADLESENPIVAARAILAKYMKPPPGLAMPEPTFKKPKKKPAYKVILEEIVDICKYEFRNDQETYFAVFHLIIFLNLLQAIKIPKKKIVHVLDTLERMKSHCACGALVETIGELKKHWLGIET